ncbi:hypothetical protein [Myceligenerans xiligouense]|uniref:Uncharacterized protein n=1 Tax=Myceligenerans xiligouense TaxID=253184 RepID=A0A3N4Z981_9MICO|nr:hypothetical protein [Myceligenerans xiligouense]RPF21942.1 hypothetical protein EDD34_2582 [Myceligenerans xiligouense]
MTDSAGPSTPEPPGGDRGDERLARAEELAQLGMEPVGGSVRPSGPGSAWPAITVALLTVAAWAPVVLTFLRVGVHPEPFAFRTDNLFWVLVTAGAPATMMLAAGASGLHPRAAGAAGLRIAAAVVAGAQLFVLAVIAVIQLLWDARETILAETVFTIVAVVLAAGAVVLAQGAARAGRHDAVTPFWHRAPVIGLLCVMLGQTVLVVAATARFPDAVGLYVTSLLIGAVTAIAALVGLWLVGRARPAAGWAGAVILCLLVVLLLGSMFNVLALADLPLSQRVVDSAQLVLFALGAVTAVLAARAGTRSAGTDP